jgi:SPP1 family predicted phage head-tail adaptor
MLFRDVIELVNVTESINDMGDIVNSQTTRTVFANKKSIRQSEFYQAFATGLKPELMFQIRQADYNHEPKLIFNSKTFQIIRVFSKNDEIIELVCEGLVNEVI